jgi:hypothetical protein
MRSVTRDRLQTIRGSGQARPSGVVHCPGGAGPHCVAAAVGEPADSIENAIQNQRGCREPPRVDGRPRYSKPVVAHWPPPESAATPIGLLDGKAVVASNR